MRGPVILLRAAGLVVGLGSLCAPAADPAMASIVRDGATERPDRAAAVGGVRPTPPIRTPGLIVCTDTAAIPGATTWLSLPGTDAATPRLVVGCRVPPGPDEWLRAAAALRLARWHRALSGRAGGVLIHIQPPR